MAVIVPLPTRARTGSALQKSKSNIVKAQRKKVHVANESEAPLTAIIYFGQGSQKFILIFV